MIFVLQDRGGGAENHVMLQDLWGGGLSVSEKPCPHPTRTRCQATSLELGTTARVQGASGGGGGQVGLSCTPLGKEEAKGRKTPHFRNSVKRPANGSVSHGT